jgi:hypothetical protein
LPGASSWPFQACAMISGAVHACASPYTVMQWQRDPVFAHPTLSER